MRLSSHSPRVLPIELREVCFSSLVWQLLERGVVRSPCTKFIDSSSLPRLLSHFDFYRVTASRNGFS